MSTGKAFWQRLVQNAGRDRIQTINDMYMGPLKIAGLECIARQEATSCHAGWGRHAQLQLQTKKDVVGLMGMMSIVAEQIHQMDARLR